jgi:hypothetical protein
MKLKSANVRTIDLPNAQGWITISGDFNFFMLAGYERRFVLDVLDAFDRLETHQTLSVRPVVSKGQSANSPSIGESDAEN